MSESIVAPATSVNNPFTMTPAVEAFCATLRALRDQHGSPITTSTDPRFVKLLEDPLAHTFGPTAEVAAARLHRDIESNPGVLGFEYFGTQVELPASPFPTPSWAETRVLELEGSNEASTTYRSKWFSNGRLQVVWEQVVSVIYADSEPDSRWEPEREGDITVGELNAQIYMDGNNLDLPNLDVFDLIVGGELLLDAARLMDGGL